MSFQWYYYSISFEILQFLDFYDIIVENYFRKFSKIMNEATIMANASATAQTLQNIKNLKGHLVRVTRMLAKPGLPSFLKEVEGVVVDITLSCVVIHRSDIVSDRGYQHPQLITYTFSDFITGLYEYEVIA